MAKGRGHQRFQSGSLAQGSRKTEQQRLSVSEDRARQALEHARSIFDTDPDEALRLVNEVLNRDFDNPLALFMAGFIMLKAERFGLAHSLFQRCTQINPNRPEPWNNMGMCHQETWDLDAAEMCFRRSLALDPENKAALNNIGLIYVNRCDPEKAIEWADKALAIDPDMRDAQDNKGLACLMLKRWREGWYFWEASLGGKHRKELNYVGEPRWDGAKGKTVVVYGEQGIGDEISFASIIPDAIRDCSKVIIDCDYRLEWLFKRSFPDAEVHGTRFSMEVDWPNEEIEANCAIGSLTKFYRNRTEDFPGTPYLVADPERRLQWRALFDSYRKPVIGIAWNGGKASTGAEKRSLTLQSFLPLMKAIDAHWVSLEYKDRSAELAAFEAEHGIKVHQYAWVTKTQDYDDTAALVAECDLVISVTTAVIHLAGALGKEVWCLAPSKPRWFYGLEGDLPWYKSVRMFREGPNCVWPIEPVKNLLMLRYGNR